MTATRQNIDLSPTETYCPWYVTAYISDCPTCRTVNPSGYCKITHWQCYNSEGLIIIKSEFVTKLYVWFDSRRRTSLKCAFRKKILRIRTGVKWLIAWLNSGRTVRDVTISSEITIIFLCFTMLNNCTLTKTVYIKCTEVR